MQPSDEIKQRLDIVDVIRDYIQLKAVGVNFNARCPFHNEKSPSFVVSPDKQIWHCFGCGKGGDVFTFVMEMEGLNFIETLRLLAPKAGVALKRMNPKEESKRNRSMDILDLSARFYQRILLEGKDSVSARNYLKKRGLSDETIMEWSIGYSPDAWDSLSNFLKEKGYKESDIFSAGLNIKNDQRQSFYDRFRARIMFPISDISGNVVAFTARVSPEKEATEQMGKYINSPQTDLYDKSKIVFGLDRAKSAIKHDDLAIFVEGQMDVITAHQNGFKNIVATSGTALSVEQLSFVKRYTNNIAFAFDMDQAGDMAIDRAVKSAFQIGINIKVIRLPEGKDPDDYIRKDSEGWRALVENAQSVMDYYFDRYFSRYDIGSLDGRRQLVKDILNIIINIQDKIEQDFWIQSFSKRVNIDEGILREILLKNKKTKYQERPKEEYSEKIIKKDLSRSEKLSRVLLAVVLKFPQNFEKIVNSLTVENLSGDSYRIFYKNLILYYNYYINRPENKGGSFYVEYDNIKLWLSDEVGDEKQLALLDELLIFADEEFYEFDEILAKKEAEHISKELRKHYLSERMQELERMIIELENNKGDDSEINHLMEELNILSQDFKNL